MNRIAKKLVWRQESVSGAFDARTPLDAIMYYTVGKINTKWYAKAEHGTRASGPEDTWFGTGYHTKEDAMSVCETHYDNAVRKLLTPEAMEALAFARENKP